MRACIIHTTVRTYICMYVNTYICTHTYIHTYTHSYIVHMKIPTLVGLKLPTLKGGHRFMKPSKCHVTNDAWLLEILQAILCVPWYP